MSSSSRTSIHFAARAARWSVQHRRRAIVGWLLFVFAISAAGTAVGTETLGLTEKGVGESGRADRTLNASGFGQPARERIIVEGRDREAAAADVVKRLAALPAVASVADPILSADGRAALVEIEIAGSIDTAADRIDPVLAAVDEARAAHPGATIGQAGDASIEKSVTEKTQDDFQKAEFSAVPLTLAILAIAFGALVAALVPVLLGLTAVAAALGFVGFLSQAFAVEESINSIVLLIGLAVGVDYAMFYLRREREERRAGRSSDAAIEAAAQTSGHAVLVSGLTIMAAVAGMLLSENVWYRSFAAGIILVVAIAMAGSITVLPAVLSKLGDRVDRGRIRIPALRRRPAGTGAWAAVNDRVLRRPAVSAVVAAALLLAMAAPVLGLNLADQGLKSLPAGMQVTADAERIQGAFPGSALPAFVVVSGEDLQSGAGAAALESLRARIESDPRLGGRATVEVGDAGTVARVMTPIPGSGTDDRSEAGLAALRDEIIPASGLKADVSGITAASVDMRSDTVDRSPLIIGFVLLLSFVILLVTFRSIVVPIKAVVLNLLSVGAAYGVLVLVFQHGWGDSLLGFEATGSISTWVPVFLFLMLFGLSMDYHVFILSRIREGVDRGMATADAVRHGILSTAGVVTSAAVVMVGVFGIFATLSMVDIKQVGVGLAVAVLIDATIVRAVLLPATMALLGERNWWLPRPLHRVLPPAPAPQPASA